MNWRVTSTHRIQSLKQSKNVHWPKILIFGLIVLAGTRLNAAELASVALQSKTYGKVEVKVERVENVLGMPYQVDLKAKCPGKEFQIINSDNYCDVRLTSPNLSGDGVVELEVREVDAEKFNRLTRTMDPEDVIKMKPTCLKEGKKVRLVIADLCKLETTVEEEGD